MSHARVTAFLFPGQGSQAVGMGRELAAMYPVAQETFDQADAALGYQLSRLCFEGPEDMRGDRGCSINRRKETRRRR